MLHDTQKFKTYPLASKWLVNDWFSIYTNGVEINIADTIKHEGVSYEVTSLFPDHNPKNYELDLADKNKNNIVATELKQPEKVTPEVLQLTENIFLKKDTDTVQGSRYWECKVRRIDEN